MKREERIYIKVTYLLASDEVIEREYRVLLVVGDVCPKLVLSMDRVFNIYYCS